MCQHEISVVPIEDAQQLRMLSHLIKIALNHMEGNTSLTVTYVGILFPFLHMYIHQVSIGLKCSKIEKARYLVYSLFQVFCHALS